VGDALRVFESFALAPVLSQLSVPLLVLHREDDRLGPWDAEQAAAATLNSPRVGLVRGTAELGGAGHVWMDDVGPGAGIVCDWVTGILSGEPFR
jgi:hypothetical protein